MALMLKKAARLANRAHLKWSVAAAIGLAITGVAAARAETIRSMDYMTEPTANAAIQKSIDTCVKQTGVSRRSPGGAVSGSRAEGAARGGVRSLPDIIYIDNSDVAQLAEAATSCHDQRVGLQRRRLRAGAGCLGDYKGTNYALPSANNTVGALLQYRSAQGGRRRAAEDLGRAEGGRQEALQGPDLRARFPGTTTSREHSIPRPSSGRTAAASTS